MTAHENTTEPLDLRTTEEIDEDYDAQADSLREFMTGFPARPGTIR